MRHLILEGISEISDDGSVSILLKQQGKYADVLCLTLNDVTITNQEWDSLEGEPRLLGKRETKKLLRNHTKFIIRKNIKFLGKRF